MTLAVDPDVWSDHWWDQDVASAVARIRDAALRGHDNYATDRAALRDLDEAAPGFTDLLRAARAWHVRVVRHLATRGVDQFLDLAAGLPTAQDNTHQTAQRENPDAKVIYTDTDSLVLSYERALLDDNDNTAVVRADHLEPWHLLGHETVSTAFDLTRPVAVLLTTGVQHEPDDARLVAALVGYRALLPPGSVLALSCWAEPTGSRRHPARDRAHVGVPLPPAGPLPHRNGRRAPVHRIRPARPGLGTPARLVARRPSTTRPPPGTTACHRRCGDEAVLTLVLGEDLVQNTPCVHGFVVIAAPGLGARDERLPQRPAAAACPLGVVDGQPLAERPAAVGGQEGPRDGHVAGRVAGAAGAEVDDRRQLSVL